jgi:hypothetical protein
MMDKHDREQIVSAGRRSKHNPYTADQWDRRCAQFALWTRERTASHHSFTQAEIVKDFGVGSTTLPRLVQWGLDQGLIRDMGKKGLAATGVVYRTISLAELLQLAESSVSEDISLTRGRRGAGAARNVEQITKNQLDRIRTLTRSLAKAVAGDKRRLADVSDQALWSWDDTGIGEWTLAEIVTKLASLHGWANVSQHVGAAKVMLDLAATHGLLPRSARHSTLWTCHAAEWEDHIQKWAGRILRRSGGRSRRKVVQGARTLALYATRRGELSPLSTDWVAIRDQMIAERKRDAITADIYTWARYVYRRIRVMRRIVGSEWNTQADQRVALVDTRTVAESAEGAPGGTPDFSSWRCRTSGQHPAALICGAVQEDGSDEGNGYGLRPWVMWATAPMQADLIALRLPPREWPTPTDRQRVLIARDPNYLRLEPSVAEQRLHLFALVAGWAEEREGIDWSTTDLRGLVDHGLVLRWGRATAKKTNKSAMVSATCFALATLASPFLEAQAIRRGDLASAEYFRDAAGKLKAQGAEWRDEDGPKDIAAIEAAWDNGADEGGWVRLEKLRQECIADAAWRAGGRTLQEQIEHIRSGQDGWGERWAVAIRMAVLLTLLRRIPLRVRAVSGLMMKMWVSRPAGEWAQASSLAPWEGAIQIVAPSRLTKSKKPYRPYLIPARRVGDLRRESDLNRALLELYFMPSGARDEILSVCTYEYRAGERVVVSRVIHSSEYVFPALARRGGGRGDMEALQKARARSGFRWGTGALSTHFSDTVLRLSESIGMNHTALKKEWGGTSIHVIRLLFGTYWAARMNKLDWASKLLHHAHPHVTAGRYCGARAEDIDLDDDAPTPRKKSVRTERSSHGGSGGSLVDEIEAYRWRLKAAGVSGDLLDLAVQDEVRRLLNAA